MSFGAILHSLGRALMQLGRWIVLAAPVSAAIGAACAFFLWALDAVTGVHWQHGWLLFLLPVAGAAVGAIYQWIGGASDRGNNLIVEQIHEPGGGVPARMAPLVLAGTLMTHLFGGSAGREGTAVQMGGSIAAAFGRLVRLSPDDTRTLLMCGVAAGFGAVFGTPLAGAIFAMEVLVIGSLRTDAWIPCLIAGLVGHFACTACGAEHTHYAIAPLATTDAWLFGKVAVAGIAFGLVGLFFSELTHGITAAAKRIPWAPMRPAVGGACVIALVYLVGSREYLGLGVTSPDPNATTIVSAFHAGGAGTWSWFWKALFTAVTVGSSFKGGEVTPLFFIGATLGHVLGLALGAPVDLFAGLGFVAVFAGAANTPLACAVMGMELFGPGLAIPLAIACGLAFLFSGHSGIYLSQRVAGTGDGAPATLRSIRDNRPHMRRWIGKFWRRKR